MSSQQHPNRNKRAVFGWTMYDWANSVYSLTITTAIFPDYYASVAKDVAVNAAEVANGAAPIVPFLGLEVKSSALYSFALTFAYIIISIASPLLGGIADYSGSKKKYMIGFCLMGSLACSSMFFFDAGNFDIGIWMFAIAAIGYAGGNIFNDAFLPEIVTPDRYERVSARGYSMGYIGSVILLLFNLTMVMMPEVFFDETTMTEGEMTTMAVKISFLTVGIWWFGFAQVTFFSLKDVKPNVQTGNYLVKGWEELLKVLRQLRGMKTIRTYLLAFFFFNMGLQTVMYMAAIFGKEEVKLETAELIISMLLIQLIAIPGSILFARLAERIGYFKGLLVGIACWIPILWYSWFITGPTGFYITGAAVGLVMGGIQALARATYSKLLPETPDTASFFSFYSITDKVSIIFGTLAFGLVSQFISMRTSIQFLAVFFLIGGLLIYLLSRKKIHST